MKLTTLSHSLPVCSRTLCTSDRLGLQKHNKLGRSKLINIVSASSSSHNFLSPQVKQRRSANYHPTIWEPEVIQALSTPYTYDAYGSGFEELRKKVKGLFAITQKEKDICEKLKLIDTIKRLGVAYHFNEEISSALMDISETGHSNYEDDLYTTALYFRLLRQHGLSVKIDVFNKLRDRDGKIKESLSRDKEGLMSLYEASFLAVPNEEDFLEEAMDFSTKHLKSMRHEYSPQVPLHWRMPRMEARTFIHAYKRDCANPLLLEFAELDYNLVQSVYQRELKELARWWKELGFREKLGFSRDRLMENYLWAMGAVFEPQASNCRIGLTKFVCILTAIDDMYDVYGSLDELEPFTAAVDRWDTEALEGLPEYMRICYFAMLNFGNELAYTVMKDHGVNFLPQIKKAVSVTRNK